MTAESFDAVLDEVRAIAETDGCATDWRLRDFADRLQSAREAEVAERDMERARQAGRVFEEQCRADRAVGLLRDYRMAPKFSHDHAAIKRTVALEDEIDAFLSEQAGERENGDG